MDFLELIQQLPKQIREGFSIGSHIKLKEGIKNIVISGMGGSGIPGDILKNILNSQLAIPLAVIKDYSLPQWADANTLVILCSYSGNTEETISSYRDAVKKSAHCIVLTSGGKLKLVAEQLQHHLVVLPYGLVPRMAYAVVVFAVMNILNKNKLININEEEIDELIESLENQQGIAEKAKELVQQIGEKTLLVYVPSSMDCVGMRWKISFNENAKTACFANSIPEMNHNEMMMFAQPKKEYHIVLLEEERGHPQIQKRCAVTKEIIRKTGATMTNIMIKGKSQMIKIFTAMYLGDLTSYFVALKNNADPFETGLIEEIKRRI